MLLLMMVQSAIAGSGPWVPGAGRMNLFLGVDGQHFRTLAADGIPGTTRVDIADGVSSVRGILDISYGIASRASVELIVPVQHAHAHDASSQICVDFAQDACAPTNSVGVIEARVKGLVVDELSGPMSFAIGGVVRYGGLTAETRERFTNAGEGTLDAGVRLSAGKSGGLGNGYWVSSADLEALYRLPHSRIFPLGEGTRRVPSSEFAGNVDVLVAPANVVALGPSVHFRTRPGGVSVGEMVETAIADRDRFSSLSFTTLTLGGKLILQDEEYNSISLSVHRTVFAVNNPIDTLSVGVGVSLNNLLKSDP